MHSPSSLNGSAVFVPRVPGRQCTSRHMFPYGVSFRDCNPACRTGALPGTAKRETVLPALCVGRPDVDGVCSGPGLEAWDSGPALHPRMEPAIWINEWLMDVARTGRGQMFLEGSTPWTGRGLSRANDHQPDPAIATGTQAGTILPMEHRHAARSQSARHSHRRSPRWLRRPPWWLRLRAWPSRCNRRPGRGPSRDGDHGTPVRHSVTGAAPIDRRRGNALVSICAGDPDICVSVDLRV